MSESTKSITRVEERKPLSRRLTERGLTTVEYAIGLLGAAAAAMLLIRVFYDSSLLDTTMKRVIDLFTNVA